MLYSFYNKIFNTQQDTKNAEMWGITAFFNPERYKNKYNNYKIFRKKTKKQGLPLVTVELCFDDSPFELSEEDADILIQIRGNKKNIMWQKERLLNIGYENLPEECRKFVWLDCDILFKNRNWVGETSQLLDKHMVVQPFSYAVRLQKGKYHMNNISIKLLPKGLYENEKSISYAKKKIDNKSVCQEYEEIEGGQGFAWAARKELFKGLGLYDKMILGSGDAIMTRAFFGEHWTDHREGFTEEMLDYEKSWVNQISEKVNNNVGVTSGVILHLWHGDRKHRYHRKRAKLLEEYRFDPKKDIKIDKNRCLMWASDKPDFQLEVRDYFRKRKEQGLEGRKKIAILFHGLVHRSLEHTVGSFEKYILHPLQKDNDVDVFHHSWITETMNNPRGNENNVQINKNAIDDFLPYSRGIVENQEEYDATIDPGFFNETNPMHNCTKSSEDAFITAMNSLRDLESTKRAFAYMEENITDVKYDYIIVCRPDVEYLNTLKMSTIDKKFLEKIILVPFFEKWGGTNDRFAIGSYDAMKIYCNRIEGALDWMKYGLARNSESYLKEHLTKNGLLTRDIYLFFRRIRATGEICKEDTEFKVFGRRKIKSKNHLVFMFVQFFREKLMFFIQVKPKVSRTASRDKDNQLTSK